ncbi:extracellular solute-binding protein [Ructibacterium gallinarum]|uniref:Extracellular solute-binding protein n=1 Tax=Ructibacterium gallinarum TaxID=2779355 RepID=A0A9D5RAQ9_9FIRM|nr:extracellular solute-binding protein [Ructibacterium gallinarum]MBE5039328.1 extracellular solute-binding protein [Ructibacterium gallinarum]
MKSTYKKMMKRAAVGILAVCCTVGFGGCNQTNETKDSVATEDKPYLISKEPLELSLFYLNYGYTFDEDNEVFQKAKEMTNISLKSVVSQSSSDAAQALNLMISSKNIADIVQYVESEPFIEYGNAGAFEDLNPLIDQYAPNIKKFFEEHPDIKKSAMSSDGKLYFIPMIADGKAAGGWFIRQDWLDKLGLQTPKNAEEFYAVMKAFKEQDPNGNGQADEIPYFSRTSEGNDGIWSMLILFNAYKDFYLDNGEIKYGPIQPEYKEAYKQIARWYQEGLIDPEIFTRGNNARDVLLENNLGGITHDWFASTAEYNNRLPETIEGFAFVPMTPPAGPDGVIRETETRQPLSGGGWGMSTTNKHKEETMKFFDFWFTEEGRRMANFGIEGKSYNMVDGKPVFTDFVLHNPELSPYSALSELGAQMYFGYWADFWYEEQWTNEIALKGIDEYVNNNYYTEQIPQFMIPDDIADTMQELSTQIETYNRETTQKWMLSGLDVEASWDDYIANMEKLGVEEYVKLMNQAYKDYLNR